MDDKLKTGLLTAAGSQLTNLVIRSPIGTGICDNLGASHGLEQFINGATQTGALAGATLASYGLAKTAIEKGAPFLSKTTGKSASLTSAASVAYALSQTEVFKNAFYNMSAYNHHVQNALESIVAMGIGAGIVATGTLLIKDMYDLASAKLKNAFGKKQ